MLKGAAHITGGGITDNTPRILPEGLARARGCFQLDRFPSFEELRAIGNLDLADYRRTFNLGVGMILVIAKRNLGKARARWRCSARRLSRWAKWWSPRAARGVSSGEAPGHPAFRPGL